MTHGAGLPFAARSAYSDEEKALVSHVKTANAAAPDAKS